MSVTPNDSCDGLTHHAQERHADLVQIKEGIWYGIKIIVPLIFAGIGTLVAGYFEQRELVKENKQLTENFERMSIRIETMNEKVLIMWYAGNFDQKTRNFKSDPTP